MHSTIAVLLLGVVAISTAGSLGGANPIAEDGRIRIGHKCMTEEEVAAHNAGGHSYTLQYRECQGGFCHKGECVTYQTGHIEPVDTGDIPMAESYPEDFDWNAFVKNIPNRKPDPKVKITFNH